MSTQLRERVIREQENGKSRWRSITPEELSPGARYGLCISAVVPRPVAVITSVSNSDGTGDGIVNCAPFSYSGLMSHDPPIVSHGLVVSKEGTVKRDTLNNIEQNGEWVFNVLTTEFLEGANACAAGLPPEVDEAKAAGLKTLPSSIVKPPRLEAAAVSLECKLFDKKEIFNDKGVHTTTIVFGRVVNFNLRDDVMLEKREGDTSEEDKPKVDIHKLNAVGRVGGITYWPVGMTDGNSLEMARSD